MIQVWKKTDMTDPGGLGNGWEDRSPDPAPGPACGTCRLVYREEPPGVTGPADH